MDSRQGTNLRHVDEEVGHRLRAADEGLARVELALRLALEIKILEDVTWNERR